MEFVPQNVRFSSAKLSNYSRNRFKIMPLGSQEASPGRLTTIALPENALIDTSSLRIHLDVTTTGGSAGAGPTVVYGKLPSDGISLVQRLNVTINGVSITNQAAEYNSLCKVLKNAGGTSRDRDMSVDRCVSHGSIDGSTDANEDVSLVISEFRGALNEASTRFWPTSAMGAIQIEIQWADNNVLVPKEHGADVGSANLSADAITAAQQISWAATGLYMTVDTISFGGDLYESMLRQRLASEPYIPIAIKSYYTFSKDGVASNADNMVFSLSSSSIDKIYGTHRNSSYRTTGVRGWQLTDQVFTDSLVGNYFRFLSLDSTTTKAGTLRTQYQINNTPFGTFKANVMESLADLCYVQDKVGPHASGMICTSIPAFHQGLYACPLLLAHPTGQVGQFGFDSRGVASQGVWECTGMVVPALDLASQQLGTVSSFLVLECSEEIRFSSGREVIHVH